VDAIKNERGQAMILAVGVMMILLVVGSAMLAVSSGNRRASASQLEQVQAYYTADAGVERVLAKALADPDWVKTTLPKGAPYLYLQNEPYPDAVAGNVIESVYVTKTTLTYVYELDIASVGVYKGNRRTLEVEVRLYTPLDFSKGVWSGTAATFKQNGEIKSDVWSNGNVWLEENGSVVEKNVFAVGWVRLDNGTSVGGNIEAYGDVTVSNNAKANTVIEESGWVKAGGSVLVGSGGNTKVKGDVWAGGSITDEGSDSIDGESYPYTTPSPVNLSLPDFPVLSQSDYVRSADYEYTGETTFGNSVSDDVKLTGIDGIYFVNGNVNISGTYSGVATIVATGSISITNDLDRSDTNSCLALISFAPSPAGLIDTVEVKIGGTGTVEALIYAAGKIHLNEDDKVIGAAMANYVKTDSGAKIEYNQNMVKLHPPGVFWGLGINSWQEKYKPFSITS
jgi:hypothetical protein